MKLLPFGKVDYVEIVQNVENILFSCTASLPKLEKPIFLLLLFLVLFLKMCPRVLKHTSLERGPR